MSTALRILIWSMALLGNVQVAIADVESESNQNQNRSPVAGAQEIITYDVMLYNFSDNLLSATETCAPYQEDFTENNPSIKSAFSDVFGNLPLSVPVKIFGMEEGLCHFSVQYGVLGQNTGWDCYLSDEQRSELLAAMKNRSIEPVTENFMVEAVKTTVTGGHFAVTLSKLQRQACQQKMQILSEEEQSKLSEQARELPEAFIQALEKCEAENAEFNLLETKESVDIIGWENDKCHLRYRYFDLYVPQERLSELHSFDDISALITDLTIAQYDYKSAYNYEGLLFELVACYREQKLESKHTSRIRYGNDTEIITGVAPLENKDVCGIELVNILHNLGTTADYGVVCMVPTDALEGLVASSLRLADSYGEKSFSNTDGNMEWHSTETNKETRRVDAKLMYELQKRNYCKLKNETESLQAKNKEQ